MRSRLSQFIQTLSGPRSLLALLALAAGLVLTVNLIDLPIGLRALARITDVPILDMSFFYQADEVYRRLALFGDPGRQLYLQILWTFDIAIPISYALALSTGIHMAWRDLYPRHPWSRYLFLIPLLAGALDYTENILITYLLLRYPERHPLVADLAGYTTAAKSLGAYSAILLALLGGIRKGFARLNQKGQTRSKLKPGAKRGEIRL